MKKLILFSIAVAAICLSLTSPAYAWLIYSKPEFRGRIIDAETKEPIEGVVVVVVYHRTSLIGGPGGASTDVINARETLTDNKGDFYFSTYTTLINPFFQESFVDFIFFKPGFMSQGKPMAELDLFQREMFFSGDEIGKLGEIRYRDDRWKGVLGIIELPKAKTEIERRNASASSPTEYRSDKLPLLYKAINQNRVNQGWEGEVK